MAVPFQISDILVLSQLAWKVYNFAFERKSRPSEITGTQYADFVNDVRSLATNLENVYRVASNAASQVEVGTLGRPRDSTKIWDLRSLNEIVGDYHKTLRDCEKLIRDNYRYNNASSPRQGISWNVLVQPDVERLRNRISLHNLKILFVLKPFEIDLLFRIHQDLAGRMTSMHNDLRRLMGVMVPDFKEEMKHQQTLQTFTIEIPSNFSLKFQQAAEINHPEFASGSQLPVADTANSFVFYFGRGTRNLNASRFDSIDRRTASVTAYVNLLKCIWLMEHLDKYHNAEGSGLSHWPSYLKGLNQELSHECKRFSPECMDRIFAPDLSRARLDPSVFDIWPEIRRASNLPLGHLRKQPMKEIINVPLKSDTPSVVTSLKLLQILNGSPSQYRLIATAEEQLENGTVKPEERVIEVNLESASLIPLYAMPTFNRDTNDILLRTPSEDTRFSFPSLKDLLRFQHAFTGFKPYLFYSQMDVKVAYVVSNEKPVVEDAVLQLWIPKRLEGYLLNEEQIPAEESWLELRETLPTSPLSIPSNSAPSAPLSMFPGSPPSLFSSINHFSAQSIDQRSLGSMSNCTPPSGSSPGSSGSRDYDPRRSYPSLTNYPSRRMSTMGSVVSKSSQNTVTVLNMGDTNGVLHQKPIRPALVIFSRSAIGSNELAITSIRIDEKTAVNTERCDCRKANSSCAITSIEQSKGKSCLEAQRFVAKEGVEDFDVGNLGFARRKEYPHAEFKGLKRVSISFRSSDERKSFAGYKCGCKSNTWGNLNKCIGAGHQGILGEVKAVGQQELRAYHRAGENHADIVIGQAPTAV
ncbi:uncharacterized protein PADG_00075 [Paracoccidioides brasiliensis Pb18]|uniref:Uncharacterized protein n=1 Tax=Paracoccidioides brasiliensis (strain Pb18) TaxID=502780 RepID=C1FZN5_PARBD|nr:uncharacterized protein PADG_00075 [Paracoccidioides brasiliensis Pb18]EEH43786.2 hypothetical protein PADG_00075 [Paracoccidioides brasiliensis Pb18]